MKIDLRWYQQEAVDSIFDYFERRKGNPLLELPTGSGKSFTQAGIIKRAIEQYPQTRFLCLTHVKELIKQNHDALHEFDPGMCFRTGINSAGLRRRDTKSQVLFAGIQSVQKKAKDIGHVDLAIVDEAHLVPHKDGGMYRKFFDDLQLINPHLKIIGLTATPYRLNGGLLTTGENKLFTSVAYRVDILRMIKEGYLSPLVTVKGATQYDTQGVAERGGEFVLSDLSARLEAEEETTTIACEEMVNLAREQGRKHWLVFCASVEHAHQTREIVQELTGETVEIITGDTEKTKRAHTVDRFKRGELRCLVNVNVLTTGFNAPATDLVCLLRPTQSPGLYVQMLGRGMRTADGKEDALILDYGSNIERHGPINAIKAPGVKGKGGGAAPSKDCPNCYYEGIPAGRRICPECEFEFPPPELNSKVSASASNLEAVRTDFPWFTVQQVHYRRHQKRDKPDSLRVDYLGFSGHTLASEWVCLEHPKTNFAYRKARKWVKDRTTDDLFPPIEDVGDALEVHEQIATPYRIQVDDSGKYDRIISYDWTGEDMANKPESAPSSMSDHFSSRGRGMNEVHTDEDGTLISLPSTKDATAATDDDGWYDDDLPF